MKRLRTFVLIGPLLIGLMLWERWVMNREGQFDDPLVALGGFLLLSYVLGVIPLLAVAGLDELMSRRRVTVWLRVLVCGASGFTVAFVLIAPGNGAVDSGKLLGFLQLGGVPFALCSWLSGRRQMNSAQEAGTP